MTMNFKKLFALIIDQNGFFQVTKKESENFFSKELWAIFLEKKFFSYCGDLEEISCPECDGEHFVQINNGKGLCSVHKTYFTPDKSLIQRYEFSILNFLNFLKKELQIKGEIFSIDETFWQLGFFPPRVLLSLSNAKKESNKNDFILYVQKKEKLSLPDIVRWEDGMIFCDVDLFNKQVQIFSQTISPEEIREMPTYFYAGIEVFCENKPPFKVESVKIKGIEVSPLKIIRFKDWEVLKRLVIAKGKIVSLEVLGKICIKNFDLGFSDYQEIYSSISRLNKHIDGISINKERNNGYFLEK